MVGMRHKAISSRRRMFIIGPLGVEFSHRATEGTEEGGGDKVTRGEGEWVPRTWRANRHSERTREESCTRHFEPRSLTSTFGMTVTAPSPCPLVPLSPCHPVILNPFDSNP